jgi:hypothetical protein
VGRPMRRIRAIVLAAYYDAQEAAQKQRLGLWSDPEPVPPWEWRHLRAGGSSQGDARRRGREAILKPEQPTVTM